MTLPKTPTENQQFGEDLFEAPMVHKSLPEAPILPDDVKPLLLGGRAR